MTPRLASALLPPLRAIDPETAHRLAMTALRLGWAGRAAAPDPMLAITTLGLRLPTPIGLAAGFDKNAQAISRLHALGFGHVEVGTVTPLPQTGNPRPRLFRLTADRALINRMGFNNDGANRIAARLHTLPACHGALGVNLGINKQGADPVRDYAALVQCFAPLADYLVINVSSPNTPGLRDLQAEHALAAILAALPRARPPLLVKLAPDLADAALEPTIAVCIAAGVDGLVISNTSLARPDLRSAHARQTGGLSGAPLFDRATRMLARAYRIATGRLTLIGVGGVADAHDVLTKVKAGASLVQLYTAFAYAGPALIGRLNHDFAAALLREGYATPAAAIGVESAALSA